MPARKLENGKWEANINVDGKRFHKRGFRTKREAEEYEANYKRKVRHDMSMLFDDFVNCYFDDKKNRLKERTYQTKKYMVESRLIPYFTGKKMNEITTKDILDWQNSMINLGFSETYQRMLQNQVTAIFSHAERFYDLHSNPCKKVEKIGKSNAKELQFWTLDDYRLFIATINKSDYYFTLFELLFWTGMRCGELLALTYADIDFTNNQICINKTYYRQKKKDIITTPKTEKSNRIVDMPRFLADELKQYIDTIYKIAPDQRLFPIVAEAVQHKMKRHITKSGVPEIRVHDLRHSHAALLINMGVQPIAISQRLGHENVTTTMNIYGHLYPNTQRDITDKLDEINNL